MLSVADTKYLPVLIGGPHHGAHQAVPRYLSRDLFTPDSRRPISFDPDTHIRDHRYRMQYVGCGGHRFVAAYVSSEVMDPSEAIWDYLTSMLGPLDVSR